MVPVSDQESVPGDSLTYAVDESLWAARTAVTLRTSTTVDFWAVFEDALRTHWGCLRTVYATESEPDPTTQATFAEVSNP